MDCQGEDRSEEDGNKSSGKVIRQRNGAVGGGGGVPVREGEEGGEGFGW